MIEYVQNNGLEPHLESLGRLVDLVQYEDMKPLSCSEILEHELGFGALIDDEVASYGGITRVDQQGNRRIAIVGGVITYPTYRGMGVGMATVGKLVDTASTSDWVVKLGHSSFRAFCNGSSVGLFMKLGFVPTLQTPNRTIMEKAL